MKTLNTTTDLSNFLLAALAGHWSNYKDAGVRFNLVAGKVTLDTKHDEAIINNCELISALENLDDLKGLFSNRYISVQRIWAILQEHFPDVENSFELEMSIIPSWANQFVEIIKHEYGADTHIDLVICKNGIGLLAENGESDSRDISPESCSKLQVLLKTSNVEYHHNLIESALLKSKLNSLID